MFSLFLSFFFLFFFGGGGRNLHIETISVFSTLMISNRVVSHERNSSVNKFKMEAGNKKEGLPKLRDILRRQRDDSLSEVTFIILHNKDKQQSRLKTRH